MQQLLIYILVCLFFNCSKSDNNRGNVTFKYTKDSVFVNYKNDIYCPGFTKIKNLTTDNLKYIQFKAKETKTIAKFSLKEEDSFSILKKYQFKHYYGYYEKQKQAYDTLFNYALPFPKGKQYKIIQGYNGNFTHNTNFSRYTIDFNLQVGDTITAARDGIIIKIVSRHNKQGTTKKYRPFGNHLLVWHDDNTFSQYVHLKQYGSLVKVGDSVKENQPIAISGFTGLTTTPHLHFGVFKATKNGLESIPVVLNSIKGNHYKNNKLIKNE